MTAHGATSTFDMFRLRWEAFYLRFDQLAQRLLIAIPEGGRVEMAAAPLADRLGDSHHVGVHIGVNLFECGRFDLLRPGGCASS